MGIALRTDSAARRSHWLLKNASLLIKSAPGRDCARLAKTASNSRSLPACRMVSFSPRLRAAD